MRRLACCASVAMLISASSGVAAPKTAWSPVIDVPGIPAAVADPHPACGDQRPPKQLVEAYATEIAHGIDTNPAAMAAMAAGAAGSSGGVDERLLEPVSAVIVEKGVKTVADLAQGAHKTRDPHTGNCAPVCVAIPAGAAFGNKLEAIKGWVADRADASFQPIALGDWATSVAGTHFSDEDAVVPLAGGRYQLYCRIFENWSSHDRRAKISVDYTLPDAAARSGGRHRWPGRARASARCDRRVSRGRLGISQDRNRRSCRQIRNAG